MSDRRTTEQKEEDRQAMAILHPGMTVRHTLYPGHRSTVVRTFTDDAGDWVERTDGTARPRFFEPMPETDKRRKATCKVCGGKIERPTTSAPWSHVLTMLDEHQAAPFPNAARDRRQP